MTISVRHYDRHLAVVECDKRDEGNDADMNERYRKYRELAM